MKSSYSKSKPSKKTHSGSAKHPAPKNGNFKGKSKSVPDNYTHSRASKKHS